MTVPLARLSEQQPQVPLHDGHYWTVSNQLLSARHEAARAREGKSGARSSARCKHLDVNARCSHRPVLSQPLLIGKRLLACRHYGAGTPLRGALKCVDRGDRTHHTTRSLSLRTTDDTHEPRSRANSQICSTSFWGRSSPAQLPPRSWRT